MAILKHPKTAPPGGFVYRQAETGLTIIGDSLPALVTKTVDHRRYKGLKPDDPETVELEVQRQICTRLGTDECKAEENDPWVPMPNTPRFTLTEILAFSNVAVEFIRSGANLEPMPEVQRRRKICADCPLNQRATGCKCGVFYKILESIIPKERKFDDLHVCMVCSCSNAAKVNVPLDVIRKDGRKLAFPVHCWQYQKDSPLAK